MDSFHRKAAEKIASLRAEGKDEAARALAACIARIDAVLGEDLATLPEVA